MDHVGIMVYDLRRLYQVAEGLKVERSRPREITITGPLSTAHLVTKLPAQDLARARHFYHDQLGLDLSKSETAVCDGSGDLPHRGGWLPSTRRSIVWTEEMLMTLEAVLSAFAKACQRTGGWYALDPFAGTGLNWSTTRDAPVNGSALIALEAEAPLATRSSLRSDTLAPSPR